MTLIHAEDLVGSAETSRILGLSQARIGQLRRKGQFPEPVAEVAATPLWLMSELLEWQRERVLGSPGRPGRRG